MKNSNKIDLSRLLRAACAALMLSSGGCTSALWTPASQTLAVRPEIAGLLRNFPKTGEQALVVSYQARGDGTDVDLVVPLDHDGKPVVPFAPDGPVCLEKYPDATPGETVAAKVSSEQILALATEAGTPAKQRNEIAPLLSTASWSPVRGQGSDRPLFQSDHGGAAWVLAYRFDDAGRVNAVPLEATDSTPQRIDVPAGVQLVLVPASVNRPPGDQARNQIVATALTPVAVAGDAAATGAVIGTVAVVTAAVVVALPVLLITNHPPNVSVTTSPQKKSSEPVAVPIFIKGDSASAGNGALVGAFAGR